MPKFNPSTTKSDEQLIKQAKDFISGESSVLDRVGLAELVRTHLDEWYSPGVKPELPAEIVEVVYNASLCLRTPRTIDH